MARLGVYMHTEYTTQYQEYYVYLPLQSVRGLHGNLKRYLDQTHCQKHGRLLNQKTTEISVEYIQFWRTYTLPSSYLSFLGNGVSWGAVVMLG